MPKRCGAICWALAGALVLLATTGPRSAQAQNICMVCKRWVQSQPRPGGPRTRCVQWVNKCVSMGHVRGRVRY